MENTISEKPLRVPCRPLQLENPIFDVFQIASIPLFLKAIETWIQSFFAQEQKPQIVNNPKPAALKINAADEITLAAVHSMGCSVTADLS